MTEESCGLTLKSLRRLNKTYRCLYLDKNCSLYKSKHIEDLLSVAGKEISRLEELLYNQELEDSYDQNGGNNNE